MREVLVFVEGPSDRVGLSALLNSLIKDKSNNGVSIAFHDVSDGDRKKVLLTKIPKKAANILLNNENTTVVAVPDLYPPNKGFDHSTVEELQRGMQSTFLKTIMEKAPKASQEELLKRFHVFCFKHDFEVLILASEDALSRRLNIKTISIDWTKPVENQNHDNPPKRIVEQLFSKHGQKYQGTVDAPVILESVDYKRLAKDCPQCFAPFIDFLEGL